MKNIFSDSESHELLLLEDMNPRGPARQAPKWRILVVKWCPWLVHLALLCLWLTLFLSLRSRTDQECARLLSTPSPALEAVEYRSTFFNGPLNSSSMYRGAPSPEIDAAWQRIAKVRPIAITADDLALTGKALRPSLTTFVDNGGVAAELEVVHQLHCLDMLREQTYPGQYAPSEEDPELFREHIDHCIEMLCQQIMCVGDVGVITFDWVEGHTKPYPDFSTLHRCRNFEKILAWRDECVAHARLEVVENAARLKEAP